MAEERSAAHRGLPAATVLALLLLCGQPGRAELPTSRSAVADTLRDMKEMNITAILDSLQTGYDKRIRPDYGRKHVDVGITMHILSISSLSEVQMDFTLDFYFRQHWKDERLKFPNKLGLNKLTVGSEYLENIWVPDTFFANEKKSYFHTATTANEMLRITQEGKVLRSMRLTITASCPMNLQYFPMDRQMCVIEIESFAYSMDHIRLSWQGDKSVAIEPGVSLPQFRVLGYSKRRVIAATSTGNYSRLLCEIMFVRSMGYYLIQIYIPSSLIVVISWVSFWLNRAATPARVSLGVTTVLTMTTLMSSTNAALPKISYVKSIDVYLGTCFVMVFASLLEYAAVGYLGKRIQMRKTRVLNLRKLAEQRKETLMGLSQAQVVDHHHDHKPSSRKNRSTLELSTNPYKINSDVGHHKSDHHHHHNARQTVRYKVHDPKAHSKGGTLENTINGRTDEEAPPLPQTFIPPPTKDLNKGLNKLYGCSPSDIDKYSRIVFPVCFVCFNLMYWIIYLHISDDPADDLIPHESKH